MKRIRLACAALLLLAATGGKAETIYKYRLPNGRILYAQTPQQQGRLLKVMQVRQPDRRQAALAAQRLEQEQARADWLAAQRRAAEATQNSLRIAALGLAQAQTALQAQCEPGPGERLGTVGGGSRLTDAYWERMQRLRDKRERLNRAQAALQ